MKKKFYLVADGPSGASSRGAINHQVNFFFIFLHENIYVKITYFSTKTYVVSTHGNSHGEAIPMSTII